MVYGSAGGRLSRLLRRQFHLLFGAISFDSGDGALQPVLYVLPQLFFRLIRRRDRNPLAIQRDVMARHVFGAVFLRNAVIEQALMTSVRTGRVPVVGASKRILEDGSRPPRRAIPISIAPLLQEVEFVPQNLQNIAFVFRHGSLPNGGASLAPHSTAIVVSSRTTLLGSISRLGVTDGCQACG